MADNKAEDNNLLSIGNRLLSEANKLLSEGNEILNKRKNIHNQIKSIQEQISDNIKGINKLRTLESGLEQTLSNAQKVRVASVEKLEKQQTSINEKIQEQLQKLNNGEKINQNVLNGYKGQLASLTNQIEKEKQRLGPLETQLLNVRAQQSSLNQINVDLENQKNTLKTKLGIYSLIKDLVVGIGKTLLSSLSIIGLIVASFNFLKDLLFKIDQQAADFGKNMSMSYSSAVKVTEELSNAAVNAGSLYANTERYLQSMTTLNNILGTNTRFSDELVADFSLLRDEIGLSEEQLTGLFKVNSLNNNSLKDSVLQVRASVLEFNSANKTSFTTKTILDGIAKSSALVKLNFKGSVPELVKAVGEAKKLGLELDELNNIGRGLLNFEQSIAAELEAELLTGKELNLDKARYYALINDSAGLARELQREIGSAEEFGRMNVIQQEKYAEALGTSKEKIAEMLQTAELLGGRFNSMDEAQERYNELRSKGASQEQIIKEIGNEQLLNQLKSKSVQDDINAAIDTFKEILSNIVRGPLGDLLAYINEWINGSTNGVKNTEILKILSDHEINQITDAIRIE